MWLGFEINHLWTSVGVEMLVELSRKFLRMAVAICDIMFCHVFIFVMFVMFSSFFVILSCFHHVPSHFRHVLNFPSCFRHALATPPPVNTETLMFPPTCWSSDPNRYFSGLFVSWLFPLGDWAHSFSRCADFTPFGWSVSDGTPDASACRGVVILGFSGDQVVIWQNPYTTDPQTHKQRCTRNAQVSSLTLSRPKHLRKLDPFEPLWNNLGRDNHRKSCLISEGAVDPLGLLKPNNLSKPEQKTVWFLSNRISEVFCSDRCSINPTDAAFCLFGVTI